MAKDNFKIVIAVLIMMMLALDSFIVGKAAGFEEGLNTGAMIAQEKLEEAFDAGVITAQKAALYSQDGYLIKPSESAHQETGYAYGKYFWRQEKLEIYGYGYILNSAEWLKLESQHAAQVKSIYLLGNFKSVDDQDFCEQFPNLEIVYIPPDCKIEDGVFPESVKIQFYVTNRNCPEMP